MALACWDPANLLQITLDQNDTYGEIQCVGLARHNNRCRWTIEDPDRAKIRPLLVQMSKTKPELTTTETLRRVAILCLCPSYHSGQVNQVVARWARVVENAAKHHQNLVGSSSANGNAHLSNALMSAQQHQQISELQKSIDAEKASTAQFVARTMGNIQQLQIDASAWEKKFIKSQEEKETQSTALIKLQDTNQYLEQTLKDERASAAQFAARTIGNAGDLMAKIASLEKQLRQANEENESQHSRLLGLRRDKEDLNEKIRAQALDLRDLDSLREKLEHTSSQLQSSRAEREAQDVTIAEIKLSNLKLEQAVKTWSTDCENAKKDGDSLRSQLDEKTTQLRTVQEERDQARQTIENMQVEIKNSCGEESVSAETLEKLRIESDKSKEANHALTAELETKNRSLKEYGLSLDRERAQVENLENTISDLNKAQKEAEQAFEAEQRSRDEKSAAELQAKDQSLRQYHADLEHEKARAEDLEKKKSDHQISETHLKESIAACWLHGLCTWVNKPGRRSKSKKAKDAELAMA